MGKNLQNIKRLFAAGLVLLAVTLLLASLAQAQPESGAISGTVTDQTGAVVPNAKVTVKNLGTNAIRNASTSSTGVYAVTSLPPAEYGVTVEAPGFTTVQRNVNVPVGGRVGLDIPLNVGQTGTTVEVFEAATQVNTETQSLQSVVNTEQLIEMPSISRDPYAMIASIGNVSPTTPDGRGVGYAINGQRAASTNILLDGAANNDEFASVVGNTVPLDSVQEFSVITNNFTAEYGRATGGIVNVLTRSGTNSFHGSLYEFLRPSYLASNDFDNNAYGIDKPHFTRNQFGYAIGGPVVKNKLFFFSSTEWIRVRSQATTNVWVPTQQLISAAAGPTQDFMNTYGALRSGTTLLETDTKADLAAQGLNLCSGLPATSLCNSLPSNLPIWQKLSYAYPSDSGGGLPQNTWMTNNKVDYNMSDKTQMFVRYALFSEYDFLGTNSNSPYVGFDSNNTNYNNSVVYSLTHTFTPSFVSQTKVDFNRFNNQQPFSDTWANVPTLYLGRTNVATSFLGTNVALPGYLPYNPGSAIPFGGPQNFLMFYEDLSWIKGKHQIRFGGAYSYLRDNRTFGAYQGAVEINGTSTPKGMENFLAGNLYQFSAAVNPQGKYPCGAAGKQPDCTVTLPVGQPNFSRSNRYADWALYVQDAWKISSRVTLNLGLRWEVFGTQHNKNPELDSNYYLGSGSSYFDQLANGSVMLAPDSPIGKLWGTDYNNFAPRVGVAWDIFGDGSTSLRGGYGIGYERNFGNVTFNVIQNPPNYAVLNLVGGIDLPVIPVSVDNAGPLAGNTGSKALGAVSLRAVNPDIRSAYAHLFSASLEHRFGQSVVAAVEYSGASGSDQYGIANWNMVGSGNVWGGVPCTPGVEGDPGDCTARLRSTQYSGINFRTNGGSSSYNAMNAHVDWHGSYGLQMRVGYTWSHAIDDLSDTFSSSGNHYNLGWIDPFNPSQDKGDSDYDLRHRFTIGGVWNIPSHATGAKKQLVGGWSLAPIFQAYTGSPYSIFDCTYCYNQYAYGFAAKDIPINGTALTPTATPNNWNYFDLQNGYFSSWYNPKTGISDFGPFPGNMTGRNRFRTPGYWNLDLGVYKTFYLGERMNLQFRAEGYNFFNHANMYVNTGDADVSSTAYISAYRSGRRFFNMALKLNF